MNQLKKMSTPPRKMANAPETSRTTIVKYRVSAALGHVTFCNSLMMSSAHVGRSEDTPPPDELSLWRGGLVLGRTGCGFGSRPRRPRFEPWG